MASKRSRVSAARGLSARLLVLTIFFVMLSEVFIYAPSIGRYRLVYMHERIASARLASLAIETPNPRNIDDPLLEELLDHARSFGIVLRREESKALMMSRNMPPAIAATYDVREVSFFPAIWEGFLTLSRSGPRYIRVIGTSPKSPDIVIETVIDEAPLRAEMYDYSGRILALSLFIAAMTAALVYLSLHLLFVRPIRNLTDSMVDFAGDPEDARRVIAPGSRTDEIGMAEQELYGLQTRLRGSLQQRVRLAALGTAVTKINHDLRNILATAQLVAENVEASEDPRMKKVAPTLMGAIDRAVKLCSQTLTYAHEGTPPPERSLFSLHDLVDEVIQDVAAVDRNASIRNRIDPAVHLSADREQLYRVFDNIVLNAVQAGSTEVLVENWRDPGECWISISDNGPGLPQKIRERLFEPFQGSGRKGGHGLGLSIARELVRGHGGDIRLANSGDTGTAFHIRLPEEVNGARRKRGKRAQSPPAA